MSIDHQLGNHPSVTEGNRSLQYFTGRHDFIRLFLECVNEDPAGSQILFFRGDGGNGKSFYEAVLSKVSNDVYTLGNLGFVYIGLAEMLMKLSKEAEALFCLGNALTAFEHSLELAPNNPRIQVVYHKLRKLFEIDDISTDEDESLETDS